MPSLDIALKTPEEIDEFWKNVVEDCASGCLVWVGKRNKAGYGYVNTRGDSPLAHRIAFATWKGALEPELELDHTCVLPACVNWDHLDQVTHAENVRRGAWANRTHCPSGHPYDEKNTQRRLNGNRVCGACNRERAARWYAMNRERDNRRRNELHHKRHPEWGYKPRFQRQER